MSWQACLFCFPYGNFFLHLPPFHFQDQNIISLYCLPHIPHFIYLFTKNLLLNQKNIPIDIFLPSLLLYIVRRFPLNLSWEWNCFKLFLVSMETIWSWNFETEFPLAIMTRDWWWSGNSCILPGVFFFVCFCNINLHWLFWLLLFN